tara:strand:- start:2819 stop:3535 length:717 start_codon:yes stop_codon:yes gene_type:complete
MQSGSPEDHLTLRLGDGVAWASTDSKLGPTGKAGQLWHVQTKDRARWPHISFDEKSQTWIRGPGGKFWLGTVGVPTPESLRRPEIIDGTYCLLNDGNRWIMPSGFDLPCVFGLGDDGELSDLVKREFVPFYEATVKAFELAANSIDSELAIPITKDNRTEVATFVASMLQLNYYLSFELAIMLGLFDLPSLWRGLILATDAEKINSMIDAKVEFDEKKRLEGLAEDTPDSNYGSEASA